MLAMGFECRLDGLGEALHKKSCEAGKGNYN